MTVTETPTALVAANVAASLCGIHHDLERCTDLRPSPRVDDLFGRLVHLVVTAPDDLSAAVLAEPTVRTRAPRLRHLCAQGECELEFAWSARIGHSADPHAELGRFPYLDNYRLLSQMEIAALRAAATQPLRSVAFAGSGPLPLSSLFLTQELGVTVHNLDHDAEAVVASRRWAQVLGLTGMHIHHTGVEDADLAAYDAVIVAALVGATGPEKAEILQRVARSMTPGALVLIRSARGLRTLLYPEVDLSALDGFEVLDVVHPVGEVINSAIVARVRHTAVPMPRGATAGV